MVVGLITSEEQKHIFDRLLDYYKNLYPDILFRTEQKMLSNKEIAELQYTYAGEEAKATAEEKMLLIKEAIGQGYNAPLIILKKKNKNIILDGHRRVHFAFQHSLGWRALMILPQRDVEFGIEKVILGKVKKVFEK